MHLPNACVCMQAGHASTHEKRRVSPRLGTRVCMSACVNFIPCLLVVLWMPCLFEQTQRFLLIVCHREYILSLSGKPHAMVSTYEFPYKMSGFVDISAISCRELVRLYILCGSTSYCTSLARWLCVCTLVDTCVYVNVDTCMDNADQYTTRK